MFFWIGESRSEHMTIKNWDFFMNSCMEETGGKACREKRLQPGPIRKKTEVP